MARYPKDGNKALSKYFALHEFHCPCDECEETLVEDELIVRLNKIRIYTGLPVRVTSGYRCMGHQAHLAESGAPTAVGVSQHCLGAAADIAVAGFRGLELEKVARRAGFKAVGVAENWIHVDLRDDKARRWSYPVKAG